MICCICSKIFDKTQTSIFKIAYIQNLTLIYNMGKNKTKQQWTTSLNNGLGIIFIIDIFQFSYKFQNKQVMFENSKFFFSKQWNKGERIYVTENIRKNKMTKVKKTKM